MEGREGGTREVEFPRERTPLPSLLKRTVHSRSVSKSPSVEEGYKAEKEKLALPILKRGKLESEAKKGRKED